MNATVIISYPLVCSSYGHEFEFNTMATVSLNLLSFMAMMQYEFGLDPAFEAI